jgi:site-specific DNA recombinase
VIDRELVQRHVEREKLAPKNIKLQLRRAVDAANVAGSDNSNGAAAQPIPIAATLDPPWTGPVPAALKGIVHVPAHSTPINPSRREALLIAIARARQWVDDVVQGRSATFAQIAHREGKAERHVWLLALLAFLSPRIVTAIIEGTGPADLTVTATARSLPHSWAEQQLRLTQQHRATFSR